MTAIQQCQDEETKAILKRAFEATMEAGIRAFEATREAEIRALDAQSFATAFGPCNNMIAMDKAMLWDSFHKPYSATGSSSSTTPPPTANHRPHTTLVGGIMKGVGNTLKGKQQDGTVKVSDKPPMYEDSVGYRGRF
ncbi:hypothetical protein HK104_006564 [Borealophlyctis nickersoniae]|nr:hypothetical protein HK104_006564 [Borealophlyctis nickersoniae]